MTPRFSSKPGTTAASRSRSTDGREEIEKLYADLFKNPDTIQSKNTVEYAKLLAPDILVIAGTFEPNTARRQRPQGAVLPGANQDRVTSG